MTSEHASNTPSDRGVPPFNHQQLDTLMEADGLDVLIVTSKHNVQYMLGGYRFFMFDYMDAIGLSRYLPIFVYCRGRPEESAYIANSHETFEQELGRFWVPNVQATATGDNRRHAALRRTSSSPRLSLEADRDRGRLSPSRCVSRPEGCDARMRDRGCGLHARAPASREDRGGIAVAAAGIRRRRRRHARSLFDRASRPDQTRSR